MSSILFIKLKKFQFSMKENSILTFTVIGMGILTVLFLFGLQLDSRLILGINPWVKPIKFSVSILIYALTMIYVLQHHKFELKRSFSIKIATTMWIEMLLIVFQSLRGVSSHFNNSSVLNSLVFAVMGLAITYNTWVMARITMGFFNQKKFSDFKVSNFSIDQLRAIQLGLILFLIGCIEGGYMSSQTGHTVGGIDGGPGVYFLNWSTIAGDLRISHFLGLHGIQFLILVPMITTIIFKLFKNNRNTEIRMKASLISLNVFFTVILVLTIFSFGQALLGKSLF